MVPHPPKPVDLTDASRGERLHKVLADAGVASRRAAEQMIREGRVAVNGQTVEKLPAWVDPQQDRLTVDGRPVARPSKRQGHTYLLVNKPRRVISTSDDEHGRRTVLELVPHRQRLFPVGRLDADSTGLILLTDDGPLANELTHPRYGVPKTYEVAIDGQLGPTDIEKLRRGMFLADPGKPASAKARAESVRILQRDREKTRLVITLREGRNREIRRMMARLGYKVRRLKRIALGPLQLKGVASGEWRELSRAEIQALRTAAKR
ncbi:MAG: pseudouridine synthase [Phycisphaeraceae bacterium]